MQAGVFHQVTVHDFARNKQMTQVFCQCHECDRRNDQRCNPCGRIADYSCNFAEFEVIVKHPREADKPFCFSHFVQVDQIGMAEQGVKIPDDDPDQNRNQGEKSAQHHCRKDCHDHRDKRNLDGGQGQVRLSVYRYLCRHIDSDDRQAKSDYDDDRRNYHRWQYPIQPLDTCLLDDGRHDDVDKA